jgi:hypothetical protein
VPVIDRYLEALAKHKGEALVLRPGTPVQMVVGGASRPATAKPVSEEQIMGLLSEALGASYAPGVSGKRTYPYGSPAGAAAVPEGLGYEMLGIIPGDPKPPGE